MFAWGLKTISPAELHEASGVIAFDLNSRQGFLQAHVHGALNLEPGEFPESALPADKNATLVFYCSNPLCRKAPNAARRAKKLGYGNVRVMSAGIGGWLSARLPAASGE
jgi:rhodanese-related sulfurtransferase